MRDGLERAENRQRHASEANRREGGSGAARPGGSGRESGTGVSSGSVGAGGRIEEHARRGLTERERGERWPVG